MSSTATAAASDACLTAAAAVCRQCLVAVCVVDGSSLPVVRACDIEAVVSAWSGVPVERLTEDEMTKLVRLVSRVAPLHSDPVIRRARQHVLAASLAVLDCPAASCAAMYSLPMCRAACRSQPPDFF